MIKADASQYKSEKIIDLDTVARKILEFKKAGKTVGLCHGGFDLMHPGHIKHLESAAKLCDCLFVSITSDRFVAARKGPSRPIFSEKLRAYSVASLSYVDYVVISDFECATDVVEKLRPDYYIKGPDFVNKTTPGIETERAKIKEVGGEIKYTNDEKLSTTDIIKHTQKNVNNQKILLGIDRDGTLIEDVKFLGKEKNWKDQIKLKEDVINLLIYIQTKNDTVKVVISNQQGVARNLFNKKRVEEINRYIDGLLRNKGVIIDNWQYCAEVDKNYAASVKDAKFKQEFIKDKTKRKPNTDMIFDALIQLNKDIKSFDKIVIIGNSEDDAKFAEKCHAAYIDAANKSYDGLKKEFDMLH